MKSDSTISRRVESEWKSRQWLVPQYGCAACTQGCTYQWLNEVVHDVMCILGPLVDYSIHKEHRHLNTQCLLPSQIPTRFLIWFLTRHFITQLNLPRQCTAYFSHTVFIQKQSIITALPIYPKWPKAKGIDKWRHTVDLVKEICKQLLYSIAVIQ